MLSTSGQPHRLAKGLQFLRGLGILPDEVPLLSARRAATAPLWRRGQRARCGGGFSVEVGVRLFFPQGLWENSIPGAIVAH